MAGFNQAFGLSLLLKFLLPNRFSPWLLCLKVEWVNGGSRRERCQLSCGPPASYAAHGYVFPWGLV